MTRLSVLVLVVFTALLAGCVQVTDEYSMRKTQLAVSSVRDLPVVFEPGSQFALSPKYIKEASLTPVQSQSAYRLYAEEIINHFEKNGFLLINENQPADFYIGFALALAADLTDDTINERVGINPGLIESQKNAKGSFLLYIDDAKTGERVWRGVAQGFVQDDDSIENRKQRAAQVVNMLLSQYHNKK